MIKLSQNDFKKGDMVELVNDILSSGVEVKAGKKGLIQWVGDNNYMVIISPTNEYSMSKEGNRYIKDGVKIYAKQTDLKPTSMENSFKPRTRREPEMVGDWDDKQPNETWGQFNERMRKSRRKRHPEWGKRW